MFECSVIPESLAWEGVMLLWAARGDGRLPRPWAKPPPSTVHDVPQPRRTPTQCTTTTTYYYYFQHLPFCKLYHWRNDITTLMRYWYQCWWKRGQIASLFCLIISISLSSLLWFLVVSTVPYTIITATAGAAIWHWEHEHVSSSRQTGGGSETARMGWREGRQAVAGWSKRQAIFSSLCPLPGFVLLTLSQVSMTIPITMPSSSFHSTTASTCFKGSSSSSSSITTSPASQHKLSLFTTHSHHERHWYITTHWWWERRLFLLPSSSSYCHHCS